MPPLCKGRWQKSLIFDGGVADTGCGADFDVSIPQAALRLPAPFTQGSRGASRSCGACPSRAPKPSPQRGRHCQRRCKNFIRGGPCPLGLPRGANILKLSIIRAARGRHRLRRCKNFIRGGLCPLGLPPRLESLETIYHLRCKGKA